MELKRKVKKVSLLGHFKVRGFHVIQNRVETKSCREEGIVLFVYYQNNHFF